MAIRDQQHNKRREAEVAWFRQIRRGTRLFRLLGPVGWKGASEINRYLDEHLPALSELQQRIQNEPDRFNEAFGPDGWIALDDMSFDVMEHALRLHDAGRHADAEQELEDYYNTDALDWHIANLYRCECARDRRHLIDPAVVDHREGRFHASVPVALAQIEGIVLKLTDKYFFSPPKNRRDHLFATETMVGDDGGLAKLSKRLGRSRTESSKHDLSLPYRHAIMHGIELNYANRHVSTKALAALVALGPWALKVEKGEQHAVPPMEWTHPSDIKWADLKRILKDLWRTFTEPVERDEHGVSHQKSTLARWWDDLEDLRPGRR